MNIRCVALTEEQYRESISLIRNGFITQGVCVRPNQRIATVLVLQACLGLRLGDTLNLRLDSFIKDGSRWRLDIKEQKTGKLRRFTVPIDVYSFIQEYAYENKIDKNAKLFDISERQVERHLKKVFRKMNLPDKKYSTHSYRKFFATNVYLNNNCDIKLVQTLLQHASVATTQAYVGISQKSIEDALMKTSANLV